MKILLGITQSNFGGAQRHVLDLATGLATDGHDVAVVHGGNGLLAERLRGRSIRTIPLPSLARSVRVLGDVATLVTLVRALRREWPAVFHVHSSKMGLIGAIAGRIAGVPRIVFTAHGWAFNEERGVLARYGIYLLARLTVFLSHQTIAVSSAVKRDMPGAMNMAVIYNGIATENVLEKADARAELCAKDMSLVDGFWVASVAELHPVKGLDIGLEGFAEFAELHPDAHYLIIGDGSLRKTLEKRIRALNLSGRAHLLGFLDARRYLKAFDAALLPSLSEGLSYAALEAGAASLPVIASSVGGLPEIIDDKSGILVPSRDPRAIADALTRVATDTALAHALGAALAKRVASDFSVTAMVEKTAKLYAH